MYITILSMGLLSYILQYNIQNLTRSVNNAYRVDPIGQAR
jgi:hypothetical protein